MFQGNFWRFVATINAFSMGATEVVCKDGAANGVGWAEDSDAQLLTAARAAASAYRKIHGSRVSSISAPGHRIARFTGGGSLRTNAVVVLGTSTGGPQALAHLTPQFPANMPSRVVAQHMPPLYTGSFAKRLYAESAVRVLETSGGEALEAGTTDIAPGGAADQHKSERFTLRATGT